MPIVFGLVSFWFGAIIGSFLNVVVWRLPRGESLSRPPSHCPKCGHPIRPWENIPIISWLCLGGRCSSCHLPISWMYPVGEAAVGALYLAIAWRVYSRGMAFATLPGWWWLAGAMLSAARIDAAHRFIPDKLTYSGMAAALLFAVAFPYGRPAIDRPDDLDCGSLLAGQLVSFIQRQVPGGTGLRLAAAADCLLGILLALVLLGAAYWAGCVLLNWRRRRTGAGPAREPMGWGDIKLLMMTSAFLGADSCIYILAGGALLGFAYAFIRQACRGHNRQQRRDFGRGRQAQRTPSDHQEGALPFAPFLAVPTLLWMAGGNWLYLLYRWFS